MNKGVEVRNMIVECSTNGEGRNIEGFAICTGVLS